MRSKTKITKLERQILSHLESNSRLPFTRIASRSKKSQQMISYKVNSLINQSIIQNFYSLIDYSRLNVICFWVFFRLSYIQKGKVDDLIKTLMKSKHISIVSTCGGKFDLMCSFLSRNASEFNKMLKEIMFKYPKQLKNYTVLTAIVNRDFGRKYLLGSYYKTNEVIYGGDRLPEKFDELDYKILKTLSGNARVSSGVLAKKLVVGAKTILSRIKKLEDREIILGYKPKLNLSFLNYSSMLVLLNYHNISRDIEDDLVNYLKNHPNIIGITKTLGKWDIIIKVEAAKRTELRKIEMDLRERFALLIKEVELIPIYNEYIENYFPEFVDGNL
ncbi:Lrp/AsnC family transcriptional regulator [Candidatus Woesearchaeota archaeon]|jgi:Lrp/AsnC family transcriptional regulator, leucine-responsive regulatory protein|nr:Lrp/AsnC family transcriptional regulator [Candidatus Woesearchaeota archaeon]